MKYLVQQTWGEHNVGDVLDDTAFDETVTEEVLQGLLTGATLVAQPEVITDATLVEHPEYAQAGYAVGDTEPLPYFPDDTTTFFEFTATQEFLDANPELAEEVKVGDVIELPVLPVKELPPPPPPTPPQLVYQGKKVVADIVRVVNDISYHHVTLDDASEADVTDTDYDAMVAAAQQ